MDIACFVGLIDYRGSSAPDVELWLKEQGWLNGTKDFSTLLDVPVPVESWDSFERLFAWDERQLNDKGLAGATYLGTAVRSFFAQGGRKCYVIRTGEPLKLDATRTAREAQLEKIIPGYPGVVRSSKSDRTTWQGVGHLFGLPDVSFLCMPDLPDLLQSDSPRFPTDKPEVPELPEQFVLCSDPLKTPPQDNAVARIPAPRCDADGYTKWSKAVHMVAAFIAGHRREVQIVAGIPLPDSSTGAKSNLLAYMHQQEWLSGTLDSNSSISSAFVQLCYPWLRTPGSTYLPEQGETPEGSLAGLLARNALTRGAFRSVTGLQQRDISGLLPKLRQDQMFALYDKAPQQGSPKAALIDRVSLFSSTPQGIQVVSDVTTSNEVSHRQASINRIIATVVRAARRAGEAYAFESSGERLWARLRDGLSDLLQTMHTIGALQGATPGDAFHVRCDRSTMTQHDIDAGRVIAHVLIQPAASVESIEILLSMGNGGQVYVPSSGIQGALA